MLMDASAMRLFDQSTVKKRKYTAASTRKRNARGQGSLLEREAGPRLCAENWPKRGLAACVLRKGN